ncbi:DUF1963 domain-containing protein [Streptomyces cadmiisoli]|uniref:DUF1963 domain-containing protein n=1 Tax=Streptomyces cadmiisoli TaxID=2184053 RepID=UPI0036679999
MSGFGQWLARFINDKGELGDFARYAAADQHMPPPTISDRVTYFLWLTRHPDTANIDGRLSHPHLPTFTSAWQRYLHETVADTSPPGPAIEDAPAEHTYEALLAAMEGGTQESVAAHLSGTALDAEQRRSLISRATLVRLALAEYLISLGEQSGARYVRMSTVGFVCHTDADAAADWLVRPGFAGRRPAGPEEMAAHLADAVVACWEPERIADFIRAAATGPHAAALYPLVMVLCRRTGITVEPTSLLAEGCLDFYSGSDGANRFPHGLAVGADLREDPLLPRVLPELRFADYSVYHHLDDTLSGGGRRFVRFVLEHGLLDRDLFLRKVVQDLRRLTDQESSAADALMTVFEDLQPSEEEFTDCHESYARFASVASSSQMRGDLTARAVGTLLREQRLLPQWVDAWVKGALEENPDHPAPSSRNCAVAIGEVGESLLVGDGHIADLVQFVTGTRATRPLYTLRALTRHAEHGRLTTDQIVACAREALTWPEEDVATSLITLLGRVLEREPDHVGTVLPLLADAFWHPSRVVQDQALALARQHIERADENTRALLAIAARQLEPDLRTRAHAGFGAAPRTDVRAEPSTAGQPRQHDTSPFDLSVFDPLLRILPGEAQDRWRALLRPAIALDLGEGEGPVVGQVGGLPELPKDTPWPVWQERSLTLLASLNCASLPREELDIPLPEDGTLLFFRYLWKDDPDALDYYVGSEAYELGAGTKLLYIPAAVPTRPRPAPVGREILERVPLRLDRVMLTMPDIDDIHLRDAAIETGLECYAEAYETVREGVHELYGGHCAEIGGHARWYDNAEELGVARRLLGPEATEEAVRREARALVLLASIWDEPAYSSTYWLIRREDLAARRFDRVIPVSQ